MLFMAESLGWEDPLEKEMATPSSILAWRIPRIEEPGGLQSTGSQRVGHNWVTSLRLHYGWVVFHCTYAPRLLCPFICWWTFSFCFHVSRFPSSLAPTLPPLGVHHVPSSVSGRLSQRSGDNSIHKEPSLQCNTEHKISRYSATECNRCCGGEQQRTGVWSKLEWWQRKGLDSCLEEILF